MVGWRQTLAVWPALLVVGGTFAGAQFAWSNFVGFELVDLVSAVASLLAGVVLLRFWRPKDEWRFAHDDEKPATIPDESGPVPAADVLTVGRVARAWMPFALLSRGRAGLGPPRGEAVDGGQCVVEARDARPPREGRQGPGRHRPRAADGEGPRAGLPDIVPVSSTGTAVFLAAVASGLLLGLAPAALAAMLGRTIARLVPAIAAILCMLALGFVTKSSGMDVVLGLAFTRTGPWLYPIFGTLLGWLGVALDRLGHVEQRPVRQPPADHGRAARAEPDPDGLGQHDRRSDGQDDRRPVDRRGRRRDRRGRQGREPAPRRLLAQPGPGAAGRGDRLAVRPRLPRAGADGTGFEGKTPLPPSRDWREGRRFRPWYGAPRGGGRDRGR